MFLTKILTLLKTKKIIFSTGNLLPNLKLTLQTSFVSNCFVSMIIVLYILTAIYSIGYLNFERDKRKVRFHVSMLCSVLITICLAYSANLFTAFVFYDLLSVSTYLLVKHHGDEKSEKHALNYLFYLLVPSMLLLLPAIIQIYYISGNTNFAENGMLNNIPVSKAYVNILLLMFIYGISKTALYPLHKWLIHAMVAPSPVSALLHAVLVVKGGLFLLYKVITETFGVEFLQKNTYQFYNIYWPVYISAISIILSAISAIRSENIKQRLAYSTISQIGYISMCFFALSKESILAGQVYFLAHSFAKISLFFYAGYLLARYHVSNITELKFRRNHLNIALSILWIIPVLSLMSMPMTIGFIGKHSLINGLLFAQTDILFLIIIFVGMMLCIFYIYPIFYHLLIFNNDSRFKGQKIETSCIYIAVISIAVLIIGGFFILHKIV